MLPALVDQNLRIRMGKQKYQRADKFVAAWHRRRRQVGQLNPAIPNFSPASQIVVRVLELTGPVQKAQVSGLENRVELVRALRPSHSRSCEAPDCKALPKLF